jgi:4-carboxymuconolactone decarboxylase
MIQEVQVYSADKEQRFPLLKLEQLNDQQRPFADESLKVASIGISGPFNMMSRSPVMSQRMFAVLDYLRFNTSVSRKLNEFPILIQARLWGFASGVDRSLPARAEGRAAASGCR